MATGPAFRRDPATPGAPERLPRTGVRAEVKPHHARGVRDGLLQLLRAPTNVRRLLVTYRTQAAGDPTRYEVLLADPAQVTQALSVLRRDPRTRVDVRSWYLIGTFTAPEAAEPIPRWACPTELGVALEGKVRAAYQRFMRRTVDPAFTLPTRSRSAHATGHDIVHEELAGFLRELGGQLRAQGLLPRGPWLIRG